MKIAFIWPTKDALLRYPYTRDGLHAALKIIGKKHKVDVYLGDSFMKLKHRYDMFLVMTDSTDNSVDYLPKSGIRGIILTKEPSVFHNLTKFDAVFCETKIIKKIVKSKHPNAVFAIGTDEAFFTPDDSIIKDIPYFYPAPFTPKSNHQAIIRYANGIRCVGVLKPDGAEDLERLMERGVIVEVGMFTPEHIRGLYRRSHGVVIPALEGGERTVLETLSCDLFPDVNPDNRNARSLVDEYVNSHYETPRDFILGRYSAKHYATKILEGLNLQI